MVVDDEPTDHRSIVREYSDRLIAHHSACLDSQAVKSTIADVALEKDWWRTVDGRRAVFSRATQLIDTALEKETNGDVAYRIREEVLREAGMSSTLVVEDLVRSRAVDQKPGKARSDSLIRNSSHFIGSALWLPEKAWEACGWPCR